MPPNPQKTYLTKAKYDTYKKELEYMEREGTEKLSQLLASSPGSGMGRPLDLPVHDLARRFYAEMDILRRKLNNAIIVEDYIQTLSDHTVVDIGATVAITDQQSNEAQVFTILGPDEVDPNNGRISYRSPLGSSLIAKKKNDTVLTRTGARYRINQVEYIPFDFSYEPFDWERQLRTISN